MSSNQSPLFASNPPQAAGRGWALWICLVALAAAPGCQVLGKPGLGKLGGGASADEATPLRGNASVEVYQRIREAKSQNSIVLQVAGDSTPIRVLPLPPDGRAVFVSDLLQQTGVLDKLGHVRATLYRNTPQAPSGIPMEVRFDESSGAVRPEADYALQAGDRLKVVKEERSAFGGMFDQLLPANGARALRGY